MQKYTPKNPKNIGILTNGDKKNLYIIITYLTPSLSNLHRYM